MTFSPPPLRVWAEWWIIGNEQTQRPFLLTEGKGQVCRDLMMPFTEPVQYLKKELVATAFLLIWLEGFRDLFKRGREAGPETNKGRQTETSKNCQRQREKERKQKPEGQRRIDPEERKRENRKKKLDSTHNKEPAPSSGQWTGEDEQKLKDKKTKSSLRHQEATELPTLQGCIAHSQSALV